MKKKVYVLGWKMGEKHGVAIRLKKQDRDVVLSGLLTQHAPTHPQFSEVLYQLTTGNINKAARIYFNGHPTDTCELSTATIELPSSFKKYQ